MGRIEVVLGPDADWDAVRERVSHVFGIAQLRAGRARARSTSTRSPRRSSRTSGPREPGDVPRLGAARRQALSADLAADRARGRRPDQGGARTGRSISTNPELTIHVEALTDEAFYSFGKERGAGGLPVGVSGRVACLLSGGIDSPVAAWRMMRRGCRVALRPLPQLSDPVARVAGEGARAARSCWPGSSSIRGCSSCRSARSSSGSCSPSPPPLRVVDLPAADDADRRADRATRPRPGARHRRRRRAGRVADAREHDVDRQRRDACRCCGRSSAWTRTRSPPKRSGSAPIRSRSFPIRTAARCSRRGTRRRARARPRGRARRGGTADRRNRRAGGRGCRVEDFQFPVLK